MKIEANLSLSNASLSELNAPAKTAGRAATQVVSGTDGDSVALSTGADRVTLLSARALEAPDVRHDRVASLAAAIRDGSYAVNEVQIAKAIYEQLRQA